MRDWEKRLVEMNGSAVPILLGMVLARSDRIEERLDRLERPEPCRPQLDHHAWKIATAAGLVAGHRSLTGEWPALSLVAAWLGIG